MRLYFTRDLLVLISFNNFFKFFVNFSVDFAILLVKAKEHLAIVADDFEITSVK